MNLSEDVSTVLICYGITFCAFFVITLCASACSDRKQRRQEMEEAKKKPPFWLAQHRAPMLYPPRNHQQPTCYGAAPHSYTAQY